MILVSNEGIFGFRIANYQWVGLSLYQKMLDKERTRALAREWEITPVLNNLTGDRDKLDTHLPVDAIPMEYGVSVGIVSEAPASLLPIKSWLSSFFSATASSSHSSTPQY
jgi:hypothetical protein